MTTATHPAHMADDIAANAATDRIASLADDIADALGGADVDEARLALALALASLCDLDDNPEGAFARAVVALTTFHLREADGGR